MFRLHSMQIAIWQPTLLGQKIFAALDVVLLLLAKLLIHFSVSFSSIEAKSFRLQSQMSKDVT